MRVEINKEKLSVVSKISRLSWTTQQLYVLERMYHKGYSHDKIAQRLKRTPNAIQKALLRFGIREKRVVNHTQRQCPLCKGKKYVPVNGNDGG